MTTLNCFLRGDDPTHIFTVKVKEDEFVCALKDAIWEALYGKLPYVDGPSDLVLWKASIPWHRELKQSVEQLSLDMNSQMSASSRLSEFFSFSEPSNNIHIIVNRAVYLKPAQPDIQWIVEFHDKLWGRKDLFNDIFRTVTLVGEDLSRLQRELHSMHPKRNSRNYQTNDVLDIKSEFLRNKYSIAATFPRDDGDSGGNLVPEITFNNFKTFRPPEVGSTDIQVEDMEDYIMQPWSLDEFLILSFFFAKADMTLTRIREAINICGYQPRDCFGGATSRKALGASKLRICAAIRAVKDLDDVIGLGHTEEPSRRAFCVYPPTASRDWASHAIRVNSKYAATRIVPELEKRGRNVAYSLYQSLKGTFHKGASVRGAIFESKVCAFFSSIKGSRNFTLCSIDGGHDVILKFPSKVLHHDFDSAASFASKLSESVRNKKACYLKSLSATFSSFNQFLYIPGRLGGLFAFQATVARTHPISIAGLQKLDESFDLESIALRNHRPSASRKLALIFVVPDYIQTSFKGNHSKESK